MYIIKNKFHFGSRISKIFPIFANESGFYILFSEDDLPKSAFS